MGEAPEDGGRGLAERLPQAGESGCADQGQRPRLRGRRGGQAWGGWQGRSVTSGVGQGRPRVHGAAPDEAAVFSLYDRAPWLAAPLAEPERIMKTCQAKWGQGTGGWEIWVSRLGYG